MKSSRSRAFAAAFERRKSFYLHSLERHLFDSEKWVYKAASGSGLYFSAKTKYHFAKRQTSSAFLRRKASVQSCTLKNITRFSPKQLHSFLEKMCHNPKKPHIMQYKVNYQERKNNREKNFRNYRNVPALGRNRHTYRVLSSDCRACLYRGAAAHNCRISLP